MIYCSEITSSGYQECINSLSVRFDTILQHELMSLLDTSAAGRVDSVGVYNLSHSSQVHMQFFISNTNIDTTAFTSFSRCFPTPCPTHTSA